MFTAILGGCRIIVDKRGVSVIASGSRRSCLRNCTRNSSYDRRWWSC